MCLFQLGGLLFQVWQLVIQVQIAFHIWLGFIFKELTSFGFSCVLQLRPALSNLFQLLLNHWTQLWLLLDQLLTLLGIEVVAVKKILKTHSSIPPSSKCFSWWVLQACKLAFLTVIYSIWGYEMSSKLQNEHSIQSQTSSISCWRSQAHQSLLNPTTKPEDLGRPPG